MPPDSADAYARLRVLRLVILHAASSPPKHMLTQWFENWCEEARLKFDDNRRQDAESAVKEMMILGLWRHASPKEKEFLQSYGSTMDAYAHLAAGWRMEAVGMIMWSLSLIDAWPKIDEQISLDLLKLIPNKPIDCLTSGPTLRPSMQVAKKRDLMEFWHWRVRTRRLVEEGRVLELDENMRKAGIGTFDDIVRFSAKAGFEEGGLPEIMDEDFVFLGQPFRSLSEDDYSKATSIIMERHYALNWLCGRAPGDRWDETPTET